MELKRLQCPEMEGIITTEKAKCGISGLLAEIPHFGFGFVVFWFDLSRLGLAGALRQFRIGVFGQKRAEVFSSGDTATSSGL